MIDARVDDAVKQHRQKMDWLRGEEEAKTLTPPPAGSTSPGGKMGFTLPLNEAPQAQELIAPVLEISTEHKADSIPPPSDIEQSAEDKSAVPAGENCEGAVTAEGTTAVESLAQPATFTDSEGKVEKEDKTGSSPPKDGTPV